MTKDVDHFAVLEEKILYLVEAYGDLKKEKAALDEKIAHKETEVQELSGKLARLQQEREAARERLEGLLNRLDLLISPR